MNYSLLLFIIGAPICFAAGWLTCNAYHHRRGTTMKMKLTRDQLLIAVVMLTLVLVVATAVYARVNDSSQDNGRINDRACLARFVNETAIKQAPRTTASKAANDARRDWDQGFSADPSARGFTKEQLKARYLALYEEYDRVASENMPIPDLTTYCGEGS